MVVGHFSIIRSSLFLYQHIYNFQITAVFCERQFVESCFTFLWLMKCFVCMIVCTLSVYGGAFCFVSLFVLPIDT